MNKELMDSYIKTFIDKMNDYIVFQNMIIDQLKREIERMENLTKTTEEDIALRERSIRSVTKLIEKAKAEVQNESSQQRTPCY